MSQSPINSLDRFRKRSSRLLLEEVTSDEHPAGCGGSVLRWRNPARAVPVTVYFDSPDDEAKLFLDGAEIETTGMDLTPGPHQLALVIEGIDLREGLFLFAARPVTWMDPAAGAAFYCHELRYLSVNGQNREQAAELPGPPWTVQSKPDGTWLVSRDEPPTEAWKQLEFDDSGWSPLLWSVPNPDPYEPISQQAYWCNELNASFLALVTDKAHRGRVWVRKRLVVPAPENR